MSILLLEGPITGKPTSQRVFTSRRVDLDKALFCATHLFTPPRSAKFAPEGYEPIISWICGWWACAGWWALTATASSLAGQLITGIIALLHPNYVLER